MTSGRTTFGVPEALAEPVESIEGSPPSDGLRPKGTPAQKFTLESRASASSPPPFPTTYTSRKPERVWGGRPSQKGMAEPVDEHIERH